MNGTRNMIFLWLSLGLLILAGLPLGGAQADAGGWPSATPTRTPVPATPTPGADVSSLSTVPTVPPGGSSAVIDVSDQVAEATAAAATAPKQDGGSIAACWPVALVALVAGIAGLSAVRTALRRGQ